LEDVEPDTAETVRVSGLAPVECQKAMVLAEKSWMVIRF
jgi:hypothetical protein